MPLVTIAIPVYNGMPYLRDTIQSVVNQTYKDWVLYLINDGSKDDSLKIMNEFAAKDSRIIIIDDGLNKGLIARLNQSTAMTTTKYYARMDADDIMYLTRIEEQVNFLESHPEIDVVGASIMTIDSSNNIISSGLCYGKVERFIHPTVMGKSEWFKENPYCNWAIRAEDFELWTRTNRQSNFWALNKPLLFYREFGLPTLKKTLMSLNTVLKISFRYRQYNQSFRWFLSLSSKTICKMIIYTILGVMGQSNMIVKLRKRVEIPVKDRLTASDLAECIKHKFH